MAAVIQLCLCLFSVIYAVSGASYDPLNIQQPSIGVVAELNGFIGLSSGDNGDVHVGTNSSVFLEGEDLLHIIQMIVSKPPVWQTEGPISDKTPYGYLGEFRAGDRLSVTVFAKDPDGTAVTYSVVAGNLPPGVRLISTTGAFEGFVPDTDATYSFTIRATDSDGKFADNVFKMVLRGYDRCINNPCLHEGVCTDRLDSFSCDCIRPYGGLTCNLACGSNPLGIRASLRYVTDAQMSAYNSYTSYTAVNARQGNSGWWGEDSTSYVQIDFGNTTDIYRVDMSGTTSTYYYTQYYYMQYSLDGNSFYNYTDFTGNTQRLSGSTSSSVTHQTLPSILTTRYVRVFPLEWNRSYRPGFTVEMYGCYSYDN